ncbi:hypothetical protein ACHAXT_010260 [Thalassiosira profunda]
MSLAGLRDDASLPHKRLEACLSNLFEAPTKNLESAFSLLLGLLHEQSTQLGAHAEALKRSDEGRASLQTAVDVLANENAKLSVDLQELNAKYNDLLLSHEKSTHTVEELRQEVETLSFNFLGDETQQESGLEEEPHLDAIVAVAAESDGADSVVAPDLKEDGETTPCGDGSGSSGERLVPNTHAGSSSIGWGAVGRIGVVRARAAKVKLTADQTIVARLDRLEQSLSRLMEGDTADQAETKPSGETLEAVLGRIDAVETFLQGFGQDGGPSETEHEMEPSDTLLSGSSDLVRSESASAHSQVDRLGAEELDRMESATDSDFVRRGSLLSHLNERETRTGLSIDDLARQISSLRESMREQQTDDSELSLGMQAQVAELATSVDGKVSRDELEAGLSDLRHSLHNHPSPEESTGAAALSEELASVKKQVNELESSKVGKDVLEQQLERVERDMKSRLNQELAKQQLAIATKAEKSERDLSEIRSIVEAQGTASNSSVGSLQEEQVNERIHQANDALRASLDERLDRLRTIESEVEGLPSKLAEKPSQDQIEALLSDLEKRLGQDAELQVALANMKKELEQRMTRDEVISLVRRALRDAKLGLQSSKDSLMIGRMRYCLGCSKAFPAVNGKRAPLVHDALRPATGVSNRSSIRPLRALRSASQPSRPKSAIVGRFSPASAHLDVRDSSRWC